MACIVLDLVNIEDTESSTSGSLVALDTLAEKQLRIQKDLELNFNTDSIYTYPFLKALLSFKRCRLTRLENLILKGINVTTVCNLERVLLDLSINPKQITVEE